MNLTPIFEKYRRPARANRTAEIAALIMARDARTTKTLHTIYCGDEAHKPNVNLPDLMAPAHAAHLAELLVSRAEGLHGLAEAECNYGLTGSQEKRREKLAAEVIEIADALGYRAETSGDPRGAVVRLYDPKDDSAGDGFGGGWAVYR